MARRTRDIRKAPPRRAAAAKRGGRAPATPRRRAGRRRDPDPGPPLLTLSRELAEARTEDHVTAALARALAAVFPARSFAIRLVDPRTLAPRTLHARGRLRSGGPARLALRPSAVARTGLARERLEAQGVAVAEADEPLFEGSRTAMAVPLALAGQLYGVVNLEYGPTAARARERDAPLLYQLANQAAVGVRNVRSLEELTRLKTWLEDLIERANALIFVVDRDARVVVWNAALAQATGFPRSRVAGAELFAFVPIEDRPWVERVLACGLAGEAITGHELRLLRSGGGEARVAVNIAPMAGASGRIEQVIAIGQDLTPLRALQAAAEHAERLAAIGRLVAGVVHELNNPLTAVSMYSDALLEKLSRSGHDAADVEKLRAIQESGQRIQRLARDLVAYARPGGARVEPVELAGVVDEAARLARPVLKERGAVLGTRADEVPPLQGSRSSLVQVVLNLLTNAAQAVAEGGRVAVSLSRDGGAVRLTVEDEGAGMAPEVAKRAFEPFFTTRPGVGIGLGLPIVQGIVERHGGAVALDTGPGAGTRVTVTLPLEPCEGGQRASDKTA